MAWNTIGVAGKHPELPEFVAPHEPDMLLMSGLGKHNLTPTHCSGCPTACYNVTTKQAGGIVIAVTVYLFNINASTCRSISADELHCVLGSILVVLAYMPLQ